MKTPRGITRFTYKNSAFDGFRVCKSKNSHTFCLYVSRKQTGGVRQALADAMDALEELNKELTKPRVWRDGMLTAASVRRCEDLGYTVKQPAMA